MVASWLTLLKDVNVETTATTGGDAAERAACPITRVTLCPGRDNLAEMRAVLPLLLCSTLRETLLDSLGFVAVLFCFYFFSPFLA